MAYYHICPYCDAALDPDEKCDCAQARAERRTHELANRKARAAQLRDARRKQLLPIKKESTA